MLSRRLVIPRAEGASDAESDGGDARRWLGSLRDNPTPAVACDPRGRVVFWNRAAERFFARSAAMTLGRRCHELVEARDVFGNRYCGEDCPVQEMARRNEPIRPFEWQVAGASRDRRRKARVQILTLPGNGPGDYSLLHLLEPVDDDAQLREVLSILRAGEAAAPTPPPPPGAAAPAPPLTRRERNVLDCIAAGMQNKEIAVQLGISLATVRNHVHAILEKLGVHSKLEALSLAVRQGWTRTAPEAKARS